MTVGFVNIVIPCIASDKLPKSRVWGSFLSDDMLYNITFLHISIFQCQRIKTQDRNNGALALCHSLSSGEYPRGQILPLLWQTPSAIHAMATPTCISPQYLQCLTLHSSSWCYLRLLPRGKDTREGQTQTLLDHTRDEKMARWKPRKNLVAKCTGSDPVPKINK